MVPYFPKAISNKGLTVYAISLLIVSVVFINYAMGVVWIAMGLLEVALFFLLSNRLSIDWQYFSHKTFAQNLFGIGFLLRAVWVIFSYYFYTYHTGIPFEFDPADSLYYYEESEWLRKESLSQIWYYLIVVPDAVSDSGYLFYLALLQKITGYNIILVRLVKALISAYTCVLLYKLAKRTAGEEVGRMAGIFAMLMPNLIIYCGLHLKETEMVFLAVAFLERTDYLLRAPKFKIVNLILPLLIAVVLFTFRTVIGAVVLFSLVTATIFMPNHTMKKGRRIVVLLWAILAVAVLAGGTIMNEVEEMWNGRGSNQEAKRSEQTARGNQWARYATAPIMAPMMFVMPFSTMVDTNQNNQKVMHGGNYVRNFMGGLVLIALFVIIFKEKKWRDFALIGSYGIAYLGIIAMSGFANAERFLLPGLPALIILWAFGVSVLNPKRLKFMKIWFYIVPLMEIGWAFFKLGSRGIGL